MFWVDWDPFHADTPVRLSGEQTHTDPTGQVPCSLKFVDFQLIQMDSLVRDVIFFIITSVNDPELEAQLDGYFEYYFQQLAANLARLQFPSQDELTLERWVGFPFFFVPKLARQGIRFRLCLHTGTVCTRWWDEKPKSN